MACRICGNTQGQTYVVREMMFGTADEFHYFECEFCRCLQLCDPPQDLSRYYPEDKYYSHHIDVDVAVSDDPVRRWVKRNRLRNWLRHTNADSLDARILDVGCGRGELLGAFASAGFTSLTGIDPRIPEDISLGPIRVLAKPLDYLSGRVFDLVMLHHSLEHMADQYEALRLIRRLLDDGGVCLIRIPIASRGPWERYRTDWVEIDAPRHFFLHTEFSLNMVATEVGLNLRHVQYEASLFYYAASEMYRRGLSLYDTENDCFRDWRKVFTPAEIKDLESLAQRFNVPGWSGRAAFFLAKQPGEGVDATFAAVGGSGTGKIL